MTAYGHNRSTVYDAFGRVASRSWDTTAPYHTTYQYMDSGNNRYGLVKKIQNGAAAIQYTYDANGNITSITEEGKTNNYYYDKRNQLIRVDDQVQGKTFAYGYDLGGNMTRIREYAYTTASTLPDTPVKTITGTYDSTWKDKLLTWNGVTMTYDAVGNMTKKGSTTFTWTKGRKLSGATIPKSDGTTTEASYVYDHTGTRIRKTVDGIVTNFRMAGDLLTSQQKGTQVTYFAYDSAGTLIAMAAANQWYFYVRNAQNDIIGLIDAAGNLVIEYKYDAWGRILSTTGSKASDIGKRNPFRYRGYYYDEETGMYYLKSRYYDPELKRFICADTMLSSSINGANVFSYCENNPVNMVDYSGHLAVGIGTIGIIAIMSMWIINSPETKKSSNNIAKSITNTLRRAGNCFTREKSMNFTAGLKLQIDSSFARVRAIPWYGRENQMQVHHIVARTSRKAEPARAVLRKVGIKINDDDYLILLKRGLHQRLHTGIYFEWINHEMKEANAASYGDSDVNVRKKLREIKGILGEWNVVAPF